MRIEKVQIGVLVVLGAWSGVLLQHAATLGCLLLENCDFFR